MKIPSLTWERVNAWRLAQQFLSARLKRRNLVHTVARTGGVQAQVMSAAELAVWARVEKPGRDDIRTALWHDRTLVKTWAMRGTLHLLAAEDLPLYVAARSVLDNRNWENYFGFHGITPTQHRALLAAVPEVLGDQPMTREELAAAIGKQTRAPKLRDLILSSGWGSPLKPSAFRGELVFGPNRGQNVTFVNPAKWLGTWKTVEPEQALEKITRLYLQTYGPATPKEFAKAIPLGRDAIFKRCCRTPSSAGYFARLVGSRRLCWSTALSKVSGNTTRRAEIRPSRCSCFLRQPPLSVRGFKPKRSASVRFWERM